MAEQTLSELHLHEGIIDYSQPFNLQVPSTNLKAYAKSPEEASELHCAIGSIFRNSINLDPVDKNDFELEAILLEGPIFNKDQPKDAHYEIEIRPVGGSIQKVNFLDRRPHSITPYIKIQTTSPGSISFSWQGLPNQRFYRGNHEITILYEPDNECLPTVKKL